MSYTTPSLTNITVAIQVQDKGKLEFMLFSAPITVSCCVFLYINGIMLFTLRSKSMFRETSRYILLSNLLFADTVLMALSQSMYLLAGCRMWLTYPVCGVLVMLSELMNAISPLTLVVMSLERYVAVCYPLRHATIITTRNTGVAILVVWMFSSLNVLTQVLLLSNVTFEDKDSLQMKTYCGKESMLLDPVADAFDKAYTFMVFISAVVTVISTFVGVIIAARSATTDKDSARKSRKTLLLHLVQLGLSLASTVQNPLNVALVKILDRITFQRAQNFLYVCMTILPRCLSSLIYGIRDQTIRPVLVHHLFCQRRHSPLLSIIPVKAKTSTLVTS